MRKSMYSILAVALLFVCSSAFTQSAVVMKAIEGTTRLFGGSTVPGHVNEIDILSNSQGESRCSSCGVPDLSSFNAMMAMNPSTIHLKRLLLNGTALTSIDVTFIRSGATYYKIHMENVTVESVQESASGGEVPTVSVSFVPQRIAWQWINEAGKKISYGWDLTSNTEWIFF